MADFHKANISEQGSVLEDSVPLWRPTELMEAITQNLKDSFFLALSLRSAAFRFC
jgi:hypothetical protein